MDFNNQLELGSGFYTISELEKILRIPYAKAHRWINTYWDGELGRAYQSQYSWTIEKSRAVSFHTLIEFYVMVQFAEAGVKTRSVLRAHKELSEWYNTAHPFALKEVLSGIHTDGKTIYFKRNNDIISLDGTKQLNLGFIEMFFKNLDFDENNLATRFWPLGREKSINIDPSRKFGHPVISNLNIYPETIYNHIKAGDPPKYIALIYDITEQQVNDAIEYCEAA